MILNNNLEIGAPEARCSTVRNKHCRAIRACCPVLRGAHEAMAVRFVTGVLQEVATAIAVLLAWWRHCTTI
jgi:hypothetical protein